MASTDQHHADPAGGTSRETRSNEEARQGQVVFKDRPRRVVFFGAVAVVAIIGAIAMAVFV